MNTEQYLLYIAFFVLLVGGFGIWVFRKNDLGQLIFGIVLFSSFLLGFFSYKEYQKRKKDETKAQEWIDHLNEKLKQDSIRAAREIREKQIQLAEEYIDLTRRTLERYKGAWAPSDVAFSHLKVHEVYSEAKERCVTQDQKERLANIYQEYQKEFQRKSNK